MVGGMAQQFKVFVFYHDDQSSNPRIYTEWLKIHVTVTPGIQHPLLASKGTRTEKHTCTRAHTHRTKNIKANSYKKK